MAQTSQNVKWWHNSKSIQKLIFPAFGTILVLVAACFHSHFVKRLFKNWFFKFLSRCWFWWQLVSIQNSMKKLFKNWFFPAFGTILVFGGSFFLLKIQLRKYSKIVFSSFWHDVGFGGSFLLLKIQLRKYSRIVFSSFWHDVGFGGSSLLFKFTWKIFKNWFSAFGTILVLAAAFFIQHLITKVFKIDFSGFCSHDEHRWHKHLNMWTGGPTQKVFKNCFFQLLARSSFW